MDQRQGWNLIFGEVRVGSSNGLHSLKTGFADSNRDLIDNVKRVDHFKLKMVMQILGVKVKSQGEALCELTEI